MNIDLKIRFSTEEIGWLCFRHAVKRALAGEDVKVDIDDFDSEYYMGSTSCKDCANESKSQKKHIPDRGAELFWKKQEKRKVQKDQVGEGK